VCYSLQGGGATSQNSQGIGYSKDISYTINTIDRHAVCYGINGDIAGTLDASCYKGCGMREGKERDVVAVAVDCRNGTENETNGALQSGAFRSLNCNNIIRQRYIVRRLTPLECERLQGYPDGWTDIGEWTDTNGKKRQTSDAARYKALGNSIALPPWKWVLKRLCACYERDATMASLFDGIGGFPYLWEQLNGKGSCLWASEIEEFPIAVTKVRIGE
jgi:DNA (cytosine-5)-methyltransferase 1